MNITVECPVLLRNKYFVVRLYLPIEDIIRSAFCSYLELHYELKLLRTRVHCQRTYWKGTPLVSKLVSQAIPLLQCHQIQGDPNRDQYHPNTEKCMYCYRYTVFIYIRSPIIPSWLTNRVFGAYHDISSASTRDEYRVLSRQWQAMLQLHLSDWQFYCLVRCDLY